MGDQKAKTSLMALHHTRKKKNKSAGMTPADFYVLITIFPGP